MMNKVQKESQRRQLTWWTMPLVIVAALLFLGQPHSAQAQWTTNGNDINNTNTGNVGIGTTTPGSALEVNKSQNAGTTITVDNSYTTAGNGAYSGFFFKQGSTNRFYLGSNNDGNTVQNGGPGGVQLWNFANGPILFATNNVERIRIDAAGNIGVGTAAPDSAFHISNGTLTVYPKVYGTATTWTSAVFSNNYDATVRLVHSNATSTFYTDALSQGINFSTNGSGNSRLFISGGGNIGIGTTTPNVNFKLDVAGKLNGTEICIAGDCKTSWAQVGGGGGGSSTSQWSTAAGTNNIYYNAGNVGIGTIIPGAPLSFGSSVPANGQKLLVYESGNTKSGLGVVSAVYRNFTDSGSVMSFGQVSTADGSTYTERMRIDANGNVGIGTAPGSTYKLDVAGNINASGDITATGSIAAKYQDVAEWVPSRQKLTGGTVVILDPDKSNQVMASTESYDTRVAGVVSDQPGLILGEGGEGKVKVATTGRVKVKVDATRGAIKIGDLLVTSDEEGVAMKSEPIMMQGRKIHAPGTIIGKALEPLASGKGEILVLLSLQ